MRSRLLVYWLLIMLLAFPALASAKLAPGDFIDINGHWAQQDIQGVYNQGLMKGTGVTGQGYKVFSPEGQVSHAQLAAVMVRTFKLDYGNIRFIKQPVATDYYSDVDNQAWYAGDAVMCAINQIFTSPTDRKFNPEMPVTRIEVAVAIKNSFNAKGISVPMIMLMPVYDDIKDYTNEQTNAMIFVSNTGIMKGDNKLFRPSDPVTRAEMATILTRCAKLITLNQSE